MVACDVNGDGFSDVVVGSPDANVGDVVSAGRVVVLYGAASGLSPRRLSLLSQESPGVPGGSEFFDVFGNAVGCGRLNADRFDDVAVGVPSESWRARPGHRQALGRVVMVPGGARGVVPARSWAFNQDSPGIPDRAEQLDQFGFALLVADVTGDDWDELIVWAGEGLQFDGALFTLPGTPARILAEGASVVYGRTGGLSRLGETLVAGNFDRRGPDDVIVSTGPFEGMGRVTMLRGTPSGLTATRSRTIRGLAGHASWCGLGPSFAPGDVDGDGDDDLLVSNSGDTVDGIEGAGRVFLIRGRTGGITTDGVQAITENTPGVPGRPHLGGGFGTCVELMDVDGDGRSEAVIAHERATVPAVRIVTILKATPSGLTGRGARSVDPSDFGAPFPVAQRGFGCDLAG